MFDFNLSADILSFCLYTQCPLVSNETNPPLFSLSVSVGENPENLTLALTVENTADLAILTKKVADLVALSEPLLAADKESNEMLDLLYSHISDILSYSRKRMLS